jgi:uncharacterized protein
MGSFHSKLARLPRGPSAPSGAPVPAEAGSAGPTCAPGAPVPLDRGRVLEDLRDRIAHILARTGVAPQRADPSRGDLPFFLEHTDEGPLYVHRKRSGPAARVGRAALVSARFADPAMLALLALDPALSACDPARALYLDTETTGLAGGTGTVAFLVGLSWFDEQANAFTVEQFLLRRLGEETPILKRVAERIAAASMIVTYNGKAFDMPLLRARFVMNRLPRPVEPPHLDLLHVARRVHRARVGTRERTLLVIEHEVLGRVRIGDVSGGDIVARYAHFLRTGDEEALLGVVEHNAADVLSMVALLGLYGEPLGGLEPVDLAGVARVARRAGNLTVAAEVAEEAVSRGGGREALRARGDVAKARGDKARALLDYEALASEVPDDAVRLELAKLYEHHMRAYERALAVVDQGTGEAHEVLSRRRARLVEKLARRR